MCNVNNYKLLTTDNLLCNTLRSNYLVVVIENEENYLTKKNLFPTKGYTSSFFYYELPPKKLSYMYLYSPLDDYISCST